MSFIVRSVRSAYDLAVMCQEQLVIACRGDGKAQTQEDGNDRARAQCRARADTASSCKSTFSMESFVTITEEPIVIDPHATLCNPIERFRAQYFDVAAFLRERDMYDPHPSLNHAWSAARMVNKYGLYQPCVSFSIDYANACAEWEASKAAEEAADERRRAWNIQADQERLEHEKMWASNPCDGSVLLTSPKPKTWAETAENAREIALQASNAIFARGLAYTRGRVIADQIIAACLEKHVDNSARGKRLFEKALEQRRVAMMEDYLADEEVENSDDESSIGPTSPEESEVTANPWIEGDEVVEGSELPDPEHFARLEASFDVENGKPMVKQGSFARLYDFVTGG